MGAGRNRRGCGERGSGTDILVLCGIALFFTFNALVALTQFLASQQALQQLVFWTMGSLSRASWDKVGVLAVALLVTLPFTQRAAWPMMALRLGGQIRVLDNTKIGRIRIDITQKGGLSGGPASRTSIFGRTAMVTALPKTGKFCPCRPRVCARSISRHPRRKRPGSSAAP
ncbi:iron chelate uptake ABC transporter family permease subunit [Bradyrhizobium sp. CCBAU 11386]|uniref:iron chelate uptake ABC transporter family permease subunit n=1 Tax=Bradyrhizobium sp. CCBAU 11386 TaxID=1630837 RepID=UPI002302B137|nr:iron chelate uptake ABC transporter family permease subunit [Bradyrhizobium sp. CCBAU 11386]